MIQEDRLLSLAPSAYEQNLFETRYKNPGSNESTWSDAFKRVVMTVAPGLYGLFMPELEAGKFVPGSPQLWNFGSDRRSSRFGSSCYTGRMGDSLGDFRAADADAETVYVGSGGFGLLADSVRPRGCWIKHCSEGAMGSMCAGGPVLRVEGTTGYITGSGRARGAFMIQLADRHPDALEFILRKTIDAIGWLDDWPANAVAASQFSELRTVIEAAVYRFSTAFVHRKDWPSMDEVCEVLGADVVSECIGVGIFDVDKLNRVVPFVTDWGTNKRRAANRDWNIPMQNCNMSVRWSDEFMEAEEADLPWVFHWSSPERLPEGEERHVKTDACGGGLRDVSDGSWLEVDSDGTEVHLESPGPSGPRYQVVITTWEGLRANLAPNQNQWRDTDYARFYRKDILPAIEGMSGTIMAKQLWRIACKATRDHGDPGAVFSGTYSAFCPVDELVYGPRLSNPCSEYVNPAGGSCNLASVNLRACLPNRLNLVEGVYDSLDDWERLRDESAAWVEFENEVDRVARITLRYIAAAMEYNRAPVEFIDTMSREHFRTVGVGLMGLAEVFIAFHCPYGSECSRGIAASVMSTIALACWEESFKLAAEGYAKPKAWNPERMVHIFETRSWMADMDHQLTVKHVKRWAELSRRVANGEWATHTCVTSVAPTGTISNIAGWVLSRFLQMMVVVTGSGEPTFSWIVHRRDNSGEEIIEHDAPNQPEHVGQPWMITAMDGITPEAHVFVHAALCAFCCMSVSKTVNLPETATVEDVSEVLKLSWRLGIPGTAPYRDRSKPMQVLTALECPSGECKVDYTAITQSAQ